jgi:NADPH-dependent 2,4-dienoyl-CoA reductase/sulfur reductase-like enzyme
LLSKKLQTKAEENLLRSPEKLSDWDIEILTSVQVQKVDAKGQYIEYQLPESKERETLKYDRVLVATGGSASRLFVPGGKLPGIFTMRTPEDAEGLSQVAHPGYKIVVVGGSFIGMELASTLKARGCEVTIIAKETVPFEHVLGKKIGAAYARLLQAKEVNWIGNSRVRLFRGEHDTGVSGVELDDGEMIAADGVVLGIGVVPNTGIVQGVSLDKTGGILCSPLLNSKDAPTLFAAGDVCSFPSVRTGQSQRIEHWDVAVQQGRIAARNMLGQFVPYTTVPFFWSLAFGNTMRFVGQAPENFDRVYVEGNLSDMNFIAYVAENDDVRAVVTMNRDPIAATCLALMKHKAMPTVSEILLKQVKMADDLIQRFNGLQAL